MFTSSSSGNRFMQDVIKTIKGSETYKNIERIKSITSNNDALRFLGYLQDKEELFARSFMELMMLELVTPCTIRIPIRILLVI